MQSGSDNRAMGKGGHDINLLQQVAKQMAKDVADGDYTAIDDLFKNTTKQSQRILRRRIMRFFEVESAVDAIMSAAMLAQTKAGSRNKQGQLSMNGFLQMLANAGIVVDYEGFKTVYDTNPN